MRSHPELRPEINDIALLLALKNIISAVQEATLSLIGIQTYILLSCYECWTFSVQN